MIIGIDLGTTNSLVACYGPDGAQIIPNRLGKNLTPSVVSVLEDGQTCVVGEAALERESVKPEDTASVFKRSMGTGKIFTLGEKTFRPEELSSLVLRSLKEDAENFLGEEVTEAVISVPAYFNDAQRRATKRAGELAGLKCDRMISEPTAAAMSYGLHNQSDNTRFLVFDLGGGTFDVSILELYKGTMEVRSVGGDNYLGGEDFDEVLEDIFCRKCEIDKLTLSEKKKTHLNKQAEIAKKALSEENEVTMKCMLDGKLSSCEITSEEYEKACAPLLARLRKPIERSLKDANIKLKDIDEIVLVGGSTKMPIVRRFVSKLFGRFPNVSVNPDEVVALGAATQAAMKMRNEQLKEIVMTDVCPFTLGTDVVVGNVGSGYEPGHFCPIIERNSVIPVSRTERLYTANDFQRAIKVCILQGESRFTKNNLLLGEILVPVPVGKAGEEAVDVTYTYDINSILEVVVKVVSTGVTKRMVIKNDDNTMTDEEIDKRFAELAAIKIHPRDQEENKLLIYRGERLYEETVGDVRRKIDLALMEFEKALDSRKDDTIRETRESFKMLLDDLSETKWDE
ncbi:MAG: molecular chaperone HscC [Lachnospiraceae bacterium]|nr:molecular chaperone HscC [Lachnospiraceae bacterium]